MQTIIVAFGGLINSSIKVLVGVALLVFLWGLATFVFKSGDSKTHEEGKNRMIWGLIAIFVMFSVWGLVQFIRVQFGFDVYVPPDPGFRQAIPAKNCIFDKVLNREICL